MTLVKHTFDCPDCGCKLKIARLSLGNYDCCNCAALLSLEIDWQGRWVIKFLKHRV